MDVPDDLLPAPCGDFRGAFAAFFTDAKFRANGSIIVTLTLPRESREAVMQLSDHQGYALNVAVWEQEVPDEDDLVAMLGLEVDD